MARGDLTRSIAVEAQGEVAELKDNINSMVANLRETTQANQEQDWLKSNLARISRLMQGHRDLVEVAKLIDERADAAGVGPLRRLLPGVDPEGEHELLLIGGYGVRPERAARASASRIGEGIVGQAAAEGRHIILDDVPPKFITIDSGLSQSTPAQIVVLPILFENRVLGVLELASFSPFGEVHLDFLTSSWRPSASPSTRSSPTPAPRTC